MQFIIKNKDILGGEPVIVGTRIPVERLAQLLKMGYTEKNISHHYPWLETKTLRGALFELANLGVKSLQSN